MSFFHWSGFDEGDAIGSDGSAELLDDGSLEIELSFDLGPAFARSTPRPLLLDWEYLSSDGWLPLRLGSDQTARLTQDGRITLKMRPMPRAASA